MKKGFITNKYTISLFILLAVLATDIFLHKGMSRVMLPKTFTDKRPPQLNIPFCKSSMSIKDKKWIKGVNSITATENIDAENGGFETDIYFDNFKNTFFVYHDSSAMSELTLDKLFETVFSKPEQFSVWLDFKNLSNENAAQSLIRLIELRKKFALNQRMIVESPEIKLLGAFCDSNFFTSYYTPFFNPYKETEEKLVETIDSMSSLLKKYPVSALSGYYFQTPFLVKFFPDFPILTWSDDARISIIGNVFKYRLEQQENIKVVLYPFDN